MTSPDNNSLPACDSSTSSATSASLLARVSSADCVIRVKDLNHYFGEGETRKQVLFHNCLDIQRGEIIIMTGPSRIGQNDAADADRHAPPRAGGKPAAAGPGAAGHLARGHDGIAQADRVHLPGTQPV